MIKIKTNVEPKLKMPKFNVDNELHEKLNNFDVFKLMNKSHFSLFLGRAGSGKTSLMVSFLTSKDAFRHIFDYIYVFMPLNSRGSMKNDIFDKLPENQTYNELNYETLDEVYQHIQENANEDKTSLIIMDDVQKSFKDADIYKLFLNIVNNRRHLRTSLWLLGQNYFSIPKQIRSGLTNLFVFKCSKKEMENIFEEQIEIFKDKFMNILTMTYKEKFDYLFIDTSTSRIFYNFHEIIMLS